MPKRYKEARLMHKAKLTEMAVRLGVSQPTLSAWESERKPAPVEAVIKMAELYGVTTDYLLGRDDHTVAPGEPIPKQCLKLFHETPVWSPAHGWLLVNAITGELVTSDGEHIPFSDVAELFSIMPQSSEYSRTLGTPLPLSRLAEHPDLWVEPISTDEYLRNELRGPYHTMRRYVENDAGNRFLFDAYGVKWLAFKPEDYAD